jgi:hypothetical protein
MTQAATMLLPDSLYRRIPQIWMLMGVFFIIFALMAGPDFRFFGVYLLLGFASIVRSFWVQAARRRIARGREVTVLTETQKLDRRQ